MNLEIAGLSDIGTMRSSNQDSIAWRLSNDGHQALLVVADGMGGYKGGEIASQLAVDAVVEALEPYLGDISLGASLTTDELDEVIQEAIDLASERILKRREGDSSLAKMGTTLVLAWIMNDEAHIAHLGDSRCYLWQGDHMRCLTRDDTVVQSMLEDGSITAEDVPHVPFRNVLTRALGAANDAEASYCHIRLMVGEGLLLCSDGLTNALPDTQWPALLARSDNAEAQVQALVAASLDNQAADNVSVVLMKVI